MNKMEFENFIKGYVPRGWKESIGTVAHCPVVMDSDFDELIEIAKLSFKEAYDELDNLMYKWKSGKYNHWYFKEAIMVFFVRGRMFRK